MEGRMKALLQAGRRRSGVARKTLALGAVAALGLVAPLAMLRPAAHAQTLGLAIPSDPVQGTNFEVRHKGNLVAIIHADGGYDEATRTLHQVTMLFFRQGKVGHATKMDSVRFNDAPDGTTVVSTHTQFVNAQGLEAGSTDSRFNSLGTLRQIESLTPTQAEAIRKAMPEEPPRPVKPTKPTVRVVPPPQKYVAYDFTWAQVPGNPENAVAQMKRIFGWLTVYRCTHDKRYPPSPIFSQLYTDMVNDPVTYGFPEGAREAIEQAFANPDTRYTNMRNMSKLLTPYHASHTRMDGTAIGDPKAPGTRDVLAETDMYVQQNWRKGIPTMQIGFYLVLWDDGSVERIPWNSDAIRWVPYIPEQQLKQMPVTASVVAEAVQRGGGAWTRAFAGQAGVPANALTAAQYHSARGPHF